MLVVFLLFVDLTHESGDGGFLEIPRPHFHILTT